MHNTQKRTQNTWVRTYTYRLNHTCVENPSEDPTLSIANWLVSADILFQNGNGTCPCARSGTVFILSIPPTEQHAIIIVGIDLYRESLIIYLPLENRPIEFT